MAERVPSRLAARRADGCFIGDPHADRSRIDFRISEYSASHRRAASDRRPAGLSRQQICVCLDGKGSGRWMTNEEFARLLDAFTLSAESGDGARFARHFTEDAVYYDYIYGAHIGRADI